MSSVAIGFLGMLVMIILVLLGAPIVFCLGSTAFVGMWAVRGFDQAVMFLGSTAWSRGTSYVFLAVPFFLWLGFLASSSTISKQMYDCLAKWFGRMKGGLGVATTLACAAFGTVCGGALVTAQVFTKVSAPEMRRYGYDKKLTYGLCAAAGCIGQLIPPSNLVIVYAVLTGDPVGKLLMAGIAPGVALTIAFSAVMVGYAIFKPDRIPTTDVKVPMKEKIISLKGLIPILIVGVCVVVGLGAGIFSVAESGAVAGVIITLLAIFQKNPFSTYIRAGLDAVSSTSMSIPILATGTMFAKFLTVSGVVNYITKAVTAIQMGPIMFLFICCGIYFILGCFMDANSCLILTLPIFYPLLKTFGINTYHFAMVVLVVTHVGMLTPPVGMTVFGVKACCEQDTSIQEIFAGGMPFLIAMVVVMILFIFFPSLSTFIPKLLYGAA